jgi:hypothetical protein
MRKQQGPSAAKQPAPPPEWFRDAAVVARTPLTIDEQLARETEASTLAIIRSKISEPPKARNEP